MKPVIITITGPTCSGKTTLERKLSEEYGFERAISHTTRQKRVGEKNGESYFFVSRAHFKSMEERGDFIESTSFNGNMYGVTIAEIEKRTKSGAPVVIVCEPKGMEQIREHCEDLGWTHVAVWVNADVQTLCERFITRVAFDAQEKGVNVSANAQRMVAMMTDEWTWVQDRKTVTDYDIIEDNLNEGTMPRVISKILFESGIYDRTAEFAPLN
ncbi:guanylate kinase [Methyloversatilis sp.]|uniref:guanylate kinase n=1 Tax=Methyloversatilis sp. TaxID=2569862 RepID=UPI0035B39AE7